MTEYNLSWTIARFFGSIPDFQESLLQFFILFFWLISGLALSSILLLLLLGHYSEGTRE